MDNETNSTELKIEAYHIYLYIQIYIFFLLQNSDLRLKADRICDFIECNIEWV